jgi:hypothetical protein
MPELSAKEKNRKPTSQAKIDEDLQSLGMYCNEESADTIRIVFELNKYNLEVAVEVTITVWSAGGQVGR